MFGKLDYLKVKMIVFPLSCRIFLHLHGIDKCAINKIYLWIFPPDPVVLVIWSQDKGYVLGECIKTDTQLKNKVFPEHSYTEGKNIRNKITFESRMNHRCSERDLLFLNLWRRVWVLGVWRTLVLRSISQSLADSTSSLSRINNP